MSADPMAQPGAGPKRSRPPPTEEAVVALLKVIARNLATEVIEKLNVIQDNTDEGESAS